MGEVKNKKVWRFSSTSKFLQFIIVFAILYSHQSYAGVDLFDSNRGKPPEKAKPVKNKPVKAKPKAKQKELDLMFVGISRTGSTTLYFKDKTNKSIKLAYDEKKQTALPGYERLLIEKIENRTLYVKDTQNQYCKDNETKGIVCQADKKIIEMKLVRKYVAAPRIKPKNIAKKGGFVKIDPKDVPADKRLIKTPFGDRLVPK